MELGGALGLFYNRLKDMESLRDDMVHAWLNMQDKVTEKPSWNSLVKALGEIDENGIASSIAQSTFHSYSDIN